MFISIPTTQKKKAESKEDVLISVVIETEIKQLEA